MPHDVKWPINPNGEKLTLILHSIGSPHVDMSAELGRDNNLTYAGEQRSYRQSGKGKGKIACN